jgi:hypothetical protein
VDHRQQTADAHDQPEFLVRLAPGGFGRCLSGIHLPTRQHVVRHPVPDPLDRGNARRGAQHHAGPNHSRPDASPVW